MFKEEMINQQRRNVLDIYAHTLTTVPPPSLPTEPVLEQQSNETALEAQIWNEVDEQIVEREKKETQQISKEILEMIQLNKEKALERQRIREKERLDEERRIEEERIQEMIRQADLYMEE
jgi:hypothetical protein